jgi:hypothetical protein
MLSLQALLAAALAALSLHGAAAATLPTAAGLQAAPPIAAPEPSPGDDIADVPWPLDAAVPAAEAAPDAQPVLLPLKDALFQPIGQAEAPVGDFLFATVIPCRAVVRALEEASAALGATARLVAISDADSLVTHQLEVDTRLRATNISCNNAMVQASPIDESDVVAFSHNVSEAVHARFRRAMPQLGLPLVWGANWLAELLANRTTDQRAGRQRRSMLIPLLFQMLQPPPPPMPMQATQPSVTHQTVTIINGATAAAAASEQAQDRQPDPDAAWPAFLTVPEDQLPLIADHIHRQSTAAGDNSLTKEQILDQIVATRKFWRGELANVRRRRRRSLGSLMRSMSRSRSRISVPFSVPRSPTLSRSSSLSSGSATSWTFQSAGALPNAQAVAPNYRRLFQRLSPWRRAGARAKHYAKTGVKGGLYFGGLAGAYYAIGKGYSAIDEAISGTTAPTAKQIAIAIADVLTTPHPSPDLPTRIAVLTNANTSSEEALDHLAASTATLDSSNQIERALLSLQTYLRQNHTSPDVHDIGNRIKVLATALADLTTNCVERATSGFFPSTLADTATLGKFLKDARWNLRQKGMDLVATNPAQLLAMETVVAPAAGALTVALRTPIVKADTGYTLFRHRPHPIPLDGGFVTLGRSGDTFAVSDDGKFFRALNDAHFADCRKAAGKFLCPALDAVATLEAAREHDCLAHLFSFTATEEAAELCGYHQLPADTPPLFLAGADILQRDPEPLTITCPGRPSRRVAAADVPNTILEPGCTARTSTGEATAKAIPTPLLTGSAAPRRAKRSDREIPPKDSDRTVTLDPFNRLTTAIGAQGMTRQQMRAARTAFLDLIRTQVTTLLQQAMPTGQGRTQQRVAANMLSSITPANEFFATAFERAIESVGNAIRDHQANGPTVILVTCLLAINSIIMATLAAVTCRYRAPSTNADEGDRDRRPRVPAPPPPAAFQRRGACAAANAGCAAASPRREEKPANRQTPATPGYLPRGLHGERGRQGPGGRHRRPSPRH